MAAATCAWRFRCCSGKEIEQLSAGGYATVEGCLPAELANAQSQLSASRAGVAAGRLVLDPAAADACIAALEGASCNLVVPFMTGPASSLDAAARACLAAFVGQVGRGGACYLQGECAAPATCKFLSSGLEDSPSPTPGTCVVAHAGDSCATDFFCDPAAGLYCNFTSSRCTAAPVEGQPCMEVGMVPIDCDGDLVCDDGICRHLPRADEPCSTSAAAATACDPDPSLQLTCVGSSFNGSGICEPPAGLGEPCGGSGLPPCLPGLICVGAVGASVGACGPPPGPGEPCASGYLCGMSSTCDLATGICRLSGAARVGEPCTVDTDCASLYCTTNAAGQNVCVSDGAAVTCTGVAGGGLGQGGAGAGGCGAGPVTCGGFGGGAGGAGGAGDPDASIAN
jgi:hypothetical protein